MGDGSRVPNLQTEFNYLDLFKSYGIFSDFVVPTWSPSSSRHPHIILVIPTSSSHRPHSPQKVPMWSPWSLVSGLHMSPSSSHRPHIVPVIPMSSPCHPCRPHCPHIIPIAPRRSPWSVVSVVSSCCPRHPRVVSTSSPSSPHRPCCPHVIPTSSSLSLSSSRHPHSPQKVSMVCGLCGLLMLSPSSLRRPRHPHVVLTSSRRSPHHRQSSRYPFYPPPNPLGGGGPQISKNTIRFELIKIF